MEFPKRSHIIRLKADRDKLVVFTKTSLVENARLVEEGKFGREFDDEMWIDDPDY